MRATRSDTRMDAVQPPIVPVIGDLIRQVPGTISLGQGVVHYGPPPAAVNVAREALANPDTKEEAGRRMDFYMSCLYDNFLKRYCEEHPNASQCDFARQPR